MKQEKTQMGRRLIAAREARKMSLSDLSKETGLDVKFLKQMEGSNGTPTIGDLQKITRVLGIRLGTLLDGEEDLGAAVSSVKDALNSPVMRSRNSERGYIHFYSLAESKRNRQMETYLVEIEPSKGKKTFSSHEGEEFLFVLEGSIKVIYGKETHTLEAGGSIYYDSIVPHFVGSASATKEAKVLGIIYVPA